MTFWVPAWLLTRRALVQFPRNPAILVFSLVPPVVQMLLFGSLFENVVKIEGFPVDNYYTYLAPGVVFFTAVIGIANAGVALVVDLENRYLYKILLSPISMWSILMGRLLSDGFRVYVTAAVVFLIGVALGGRVETGFPGFLLIVLLGTLFALASVGMLIVNVALRTKDQQATQAIFPVFFILTFLTTAFMPKESINSSVVKTIIDWNPAQYVVKPMQTLMFHPWADQDVAEFGVAFAVIAAFALVGGVITRLNFRSLYK